MRDAEIVGLCTVFAADGEPAAYEISRGTLEFGRIAVVPVAAETQKAELVGPGFAQGCIHEKTLGKEHLRCRDIEVGAVGGFAADSGNQPALVVVLVLYAGRDLG